MSELKLVARLYINVKLSITSVIVAHEYIFV